MDVLLLLHLFGLPGDPLCAFTLATLQVEEGEDGQQDVVPAGIGGELTADLAPAQEVDGR